MWFAQVVETSVTTISKIVLFRTDYSHPDDQSTRSNVIPLFKPFNYISNNWAYFTKNPLLEHIKRETCIIPVASVYAADSNIFEMASMSLNSILFGWPEGCSNAFSTGICLVEELALTFLAGGFDVGRFTLCLFWALLPGLEADILWACSALSFALKLQKSP